MEKAPSRGWVFARPVRKQGDGGAPAVIGVWLWQFSYIIFFHNDTKDARVPSINNKSRKLSGPG